MREKEDSESHSGGNSKGIFKGRGGRRTAVILSAFVFPGAGQFVQKRPFPCFLFAGLFSLCFAVFAMDALRILVIYYRLGLEFNTYEVPHLPVVGMLVSFLGGLLVYIINIIDVVRHARKRHERETFPDVA